MQLFWILFATVTTSLVSLAGLAVFYVREDILKKLIFPLVAFSAGAMLGGALLHMLPETLEKTDDTFAVFLWVLFGFSLFFLMEQFIHWHHCHKMLSEHKQPVTYLILIADTIHNFIDGMMMAGAFLVDIRVGIVAWLAVISHEVPQELGDFGVLVHGGWEKKKALFFNFLSALSAILGGLIVYFASSHVDILFLLPLAAGHFIYIASSDLIPEIKHSENLRKNITHFVSFILGILLLLGVKVVFGG